MIDEIDESDEIDEKEKDGGVQERMMTSARGAPGVDPGWTTGAKTAIGTAAGDASNLWFTMVGASLTEIYFPRIDTPTVKDAWLLIMTPTGPVDGRTLASEVTYIEAPIPLYRTRMYDAAGRFEIDTDVFTWAEGPVLVQSLTFHCRQGTPSDYHLYWVVTPRLGPATHASTVGTSSGPAAVARGEKATVVMMARSPFGRISSGYYGVSDGPSDLLAGRVLSEQEAADPGHVVMTAQIAVTSQCETLVLAFGRDDEEAFGHARQVLADSPGHLVDRYKAGWREYLERLTLLLPAEAPHGVMQRVSAMVLKSHQDKRFSGAMTASLAIPWGDAATGEQVGGYHLVWPRDMTESALALLALGDVEGARRAFVYLMAQQNEDGSWAQNFWLDGRPYWRGQQLDETAFPIHLAWMLSARGSLEDVAHWYPRIRQALQYLMQNGPVTGQDRWEEDGGYSPFTLAVAIAALVLGANMARAQGYAAEADAAEALADYWADQVDDWTFVSDSPLTPLDQGHYERLRPESDGPEGTRRQGLVPLRNQADSGHADRPEGGLVDGGFLALVRYGIKNPDDPHILAGVAVYDAVLKKELAYGPLWYRYNGDGYGETPDGRPFTGAGQGRPWPLLAGERGHYELAAGRRPDLLLDVMEAASSPTGLIPEQVWDAASLPQCHLVQGKATGSASPLVWAHGEFVKLLRSREDGEGFECYPAVRHFFSARDGRPRRVYWQFNHQRTHWPPGVSWVRVVVSAPACLVYTTDGWATVNRADLSPCGDMRVWTLDVPVDSERLEFTFYWPEAQHWEGRNFQMDPAPKPS